MTVVVRKKRRIKLNNTSMQSIKIHVFLNFKHLNSFGIKKNSLGLKDTEAVRLLMKYILVWSVRILRETEKERSNQLAI